MASLVKSKCLALPARLAIGKNPEANEKTFVDGRWMKTGDVGYIDEEGFIHITGRIKEIVIRGGGKYLSW